MKKKMKLTLEQYGNLILDDVTNKRFCKMCGEELELYSGSEEHDQENGLLKVAWFAVRCPNGIKAFKAVGNSAYMRPPKHYEVQAWGEIIIKDWKE